jgi:hypothetical protein
MDEIREVIQSHDRQSDVTGPNVPADPCLQHVKDFQEWIIRVM